MLNIIGTGPGNPDYITEIGKKLIENSDVLIGGKRNLELFPEFKGEKISITADLSMITDFVEKNRDLEISVIASGDPSIYGIAKYLVKNSDSENINIVPGISSMQYMFSRIKMDMNDVYLTSSHGRVPDYDYLLSHSKVCMVTDRKNGPAQIAEEIIKRGLKKVMAVGENLSYDNEKITVASPEEISKRREYDMNIVVIFDEKQ
ncbi:cobalt-precorrin-7 (C(5))-methyltransferase [Peptacetobacter hominis]|uniref:Cobalt-precorrin-7 (C(5))-methyltransferase n=1 Tax=Peptacetobacter hominis TaxID=2743610 RepID=A0A544QT38_9FIRM|nr:cobalt-precorrin-7 (C(5))-methyltransferase [Peptacetobacter hominis]TQQ83207.1 cobalt-precorrin-7 (C(5))-methyltransferase [Peptacetobacter hominis]